MSAIIFNLKHQPVRISSLGHVLPGRKELTVSSLDDPVLSAALKRGDVVVLSEEQDSKSSTPTPLPEPAPEPVVVAEEVVAEEPVAATEEAEVKEDDAATEPKKRSTKAKEN